MVKRQAGFENRLVFFKLWLPCRLEIGGLHIRAEFISNGNVVFVRGPSDLDVLVSIVLSKSRSTKFKSLIFYTSI
jgi:hypothetical protein